MTRGLIVLLASLAMVLTIVPAAQAGWGNEICRSLGFGWSDGYHSRTACPPKRTAFSHSWSPSRTCPTPMGPVDYVESYEPAMPSPAVREPVPMPESRAKPGWTLVR